MNDYKPDERVTTCSDSDATFIERIEVGFAIEVAITSEQERQLHELIDQIAKAPYNQPKEGVHWLGFVGSKLNYSATDAALLGKPVGDNPPPNGAEPDSDDTVLCYETSARGFVNGNERAKVMLEREEKKLTGMHVDDFIDHHGKDAYARWVLMHFRLPAHGAAFEKFMAGNRLFCTHQGTRYRVTGASRMGDIFLAKDFARDHGYDARVGVDACSAWGPEP
jgi:hypothetical protein